jgi:hypothetical protein
MHPVTLHNLFEAARRLDVSASAAGEGLEVRLDDRSLPFEFQGVVNPWRDGEIVWSWRGALAVDDALVADAASQPVDRASEPGPEGLSRAIEQRSGGQCEPGALRVLSWDESTSVAIVLALFRPR